jgi:Holliday junction resolvase RusA-like endonuclease
MTNQPTPRPCPTCVSLNVIGSHGNPFGPVLPTQDPQWSSMPADSVLRIFVPGTARPKGSKTPKGRRRNGSVILVESADVAPWQSEIARAARSADIRFDGLVQVDLVFLRARPKRPTYPTAPGGKPDGDKLERAVWDALTEAGTIVDDARVVTWSGAKRYVLPDEVPGVHVTVREWRP